MKNVLITVIGTTASGKSDLAIKLARYFGGEIISADSRQIYKGLDLGTGKVTKEEQSMAKHHLIDILAPGTPYSAAEFQQDAYKAIDDVISKGKLPILCGGTGLYSRAVVEGYDFSDAPPSDELRAELASKTREELLEILATHGITDIDPQRSNRHLIRMIEKAVDGRSHTPQNLPKYDVLQLGMTFDRQVLLERIKMRLEARIKAGMIDEVKGLMDSGVTPEFLEGLGLEYRYTYRYLANMYDSYEAYFEQLNTEINKFSKRQMTWFRKEKNVVWLDMNGDFENQAIDEVKRFLENRE